MDLSAAGLQEQPFRTHGKPLPFVYYSGQQAALDFLNSTYEHSQGLGLFLGPTLSGKTTILRQFVESLDADIAVAIVDGAGLNTTALLEALLGQFGYRLDYNCVNELINMLKVFTMQQAASGRPPLLIIEHTHAMNPNALRVLCELASIKVRHASALRMIFSSDRSIQSIIEAPAMECIAGRLTGEFYVQPLARSETTDYLYAKLEAGGSNDPSRIMPESICNELHEASGGWPGILDRLALLALARADECPVQEDHIERPEISDETGAIRLQLLDEETDTDTDTGAEMEGDASPRLYLSLNGKTVGELILDQPRALVGRSDHNDLSIESRFISRHHAMFIRHGSATFLMDLNSTNGTYVNSRKVSNHVMMHDDIVSLGNHSIKFVYPAATIGSQGNEAGLADTAIMKNLEDMRRMLAQENTHTMPLDMDKLLGSGDSDS